MEGKQKGGGTCTRQNILSTCEWETREKEGNVKKLCGVGRKDKTKINTNRMHRAMDHTGGKKRGKGRYGLSPIQEQSSWG